MIRRLLAWAILLPGLFCTQIFGQDTESKTRAAIKRITEDPLVKQVKISNERKTPSLVVFTQDVKGYNKSRTVSLMENYLSLRNGIDLLRFEKQTLPLQNLEIITYQQYFKGLKVEFGKYKALVKGQELQVLTGAWYDIPVSLDLNPAISPGIALQKIEAKLNAKKYATDFFREEIAKANDARLKEYLQKELEDVSPKGELVIVRDAGKNGITEMRLAWKFNIYAVEPLYRAWVYVDARSGKILFSDAIIKHVDSEPPASVATTVQTRYAGNRSIRVKQISGNDPNSGTLLVSSHPTTEVYVPGTATWVLMDDSRGKGIETYDMNGAGGVPVSHPLLYIHGKSFTDVDNNWSLAEHKRSDPLGNGTGENGAFEMENDDIAWDAHWGAEMVYDFWLLKQNRKSFDDNNGKIKSFIHYGPVFDNAFWNGSSMTYGDGSGPEADGFRALTSLDVCAHEIGHGVCEFTSNLVYERESGAMNEGFSDIWASCVENYAIRNVDATLVNRYRPFYIGEQIGATADNPLRRMDNPKSAGDPDTYGGINFRDPNCEPPDLVLNDYCGVHTNSGILNKWFYLLTVGSHSGSGPDAIYARADSDDGINDLGNSYSVTGVGFNNSERVAYLTELMLSPTSTFAEARDLSIIAARLVSGDHCSSLAESVTNAWYAVGIGAAYDPACVSTYGFVLQPGSAISEGNAPAGCAGEFLVNIPVLVPAGGTVTLSVTGSAGTGDYRLGSATLTNVGTSNAVLNAPVYIKSDAVVEPPETIVLSASITNTGSSPVNSGYTLTITDDDIEPVIGSSAISLISGGNFDNEPDGYNSPAGWPKRVDVAGTNLWGVWGGQLRITGNVEGVQLPPGNYNNLSPTSTIISAPMINATGLGNIRIRFDFRVQGEVDPNSANINSWGIFDYMMLVYSLDGINYHDIYTLDENFRAFCSLAPTNGTFDAWLPAFFNNKTFYIGFKWYNDTNAGGPESVSIDNFTLEAMPKMLENDLNHNGRENLSPGVNAYMYSVQDGQLLGKIGNNSNRDFGCTNMYVERTGNSSFNLLQSRNTIHKVADKLVRIETAINYKTNTSVTIYFTEQQLTALESATNQTRAAFRVYHVNAAGYLLAANNNTSIHVPVYNPVPGGGGSFTISFNDRANGSYALGCIVSGPAENYPVTADEAKPVNKIGNIYPNPGSGDGFIQLSVSTEMRIRIEYINSLGELVNLQTEQLRTGNNLLRLRTSGFAAGSYLVRFRSQDGSLLGTRSLVR